jgi:hypothetical protein
MNNETQTKCICHRGFSGIRKVVARSNFSCTLIGNRPQSLNGHTAIGVRNAFETPRYDCKDGLTNKFV